CYRQTLFFLARSSVVHPNDRLLQGVVAERVFDRLTIATGHGADDRDDRVPRMLERDIRVLGIGSRGCLDGLGGVERTVEGDPAHPGRSTSAQFPCCCFSLPTGP